MNLVLVSEPFTESNYTSCNQTMLLGLTMKNKIGFIDGTLLRLMICNSVVKAWILNAISKEISATTNFSDSTQEMWFVYRINTSIKISNLVQDQLSVTTYFVKLKTLWNELVSYRPSCTYRRCSCGSVKNLVFNTFKPNM